MRSASLLIQLLLCSCLLAAEARGEPAAPQCGHGLSFFGDFKYPPGFKHFDYVNPDAPKGGKLVRAIGYSFNSFTPFIPKGMAAPGLGVIGESTLYDSLMVASGDEVGVFYGNLAECISVSDDVTKVRMRLRKKARWHDGVPVTARDVKFTFEHIRDNAFGGVKAAYLSLKQVDAVNDQEVLFTYHYPVNLSAMMALGRVAILPEHYWRERDITKTTLEPPLSSGPYRIGRFKIGRFIEFERVADYWGKDLGLHRGQHNIDVLRYEVYRDATVQREALRKGLLDVRIEGSAAQWATGYNLAGRNTGLLVQERHRFRQYMGVVAALGFNLTRERFKDVRVREALTLAFDFDWMNTVFNYGANEKPQSYFHGTFLAATGLPSDDELELLEPFREQLPARVFTEPPFSGSSTAKLNSRDALLRAQSLLAEAGWVFRDGSLVNANGEVFEIEFLINFSSRTLLPYIERLKRLGILGRIRLVEDAQFINLRRNNKGDAVFGSLASAMPPAAEIPAYLHSKSLGASNFARLSSPIVDNLVGQLLSARDRRSLVAASRALDRVLYWQFYFIPVAVLEANRVMLWNKFGKPDVLSRDNAGFPYTWWWDPAKAARVAHAQGKRGREPETR